MHQRFNDYLARLNWSCWERGIALTNSSNLMCPSVSGALAIIRKLRGFKVARIGGLECFGEIVAPICAVSSSPCPVALGDDAALQPNGQTHTCILSPIAD